MPMLIRSYLSLLPEFMDFTLFGKTMLVISKSLDFFWPIHSGSEKCLVGMNQMMSGATIFFRHMCQMGDPPPKGCWFLVSQIIKRVPSSDNFNLLVLDLESKAERLIIPQEGFKSNAPESVCNPATASHVAVFNQCCGCLIVFFLCFFSAVDC